jgi:hypothetical protein
MAVREEDGHGACLSKPHAMSDISCRTPAHVEFHRMLTAMNSPSFTDVHRSPFVHLQIAVEPSQGRHFPPWCAAANIVTNP